MRIGELAAATGTTARAIRHYEQAELIDSVRESNGYRHYDVDAITRVHNIRYMLAAGLTLDDVRVFQNCLGDDMSRTRPSDVGLRTARDRLAVLEARIAAQVEVRDRLVAALQRFDAAATAGS